MAIRKRIGKRGTRWIVDYRDNSGKRHWITCKTKALAEQVHAKKVQDPGGDPNVTFKDIAGEWFGLAETKVRKQTLEQYESQLRIHLLPALGSRRIGKIRSSHLEAFLGTKLKEGYSPKFVSSLCTTMFGIFKRAVKDGVAPSNPATGVQSELGLRRQAPANSAVKAFTAEELEVFIEKSREVYPHLYPCFLTMARTGIRIGEAIALSWPDVDLEGTRHHGKKIYQITVRGSMRRDGEIELPKNGRVRRVDMSRGLRGELRKHYKKHREEYLRRGRVGEDWVFQRPVDSRTRGAGLHLRPHSVDTQFKKVLKAAELPEHFYPHSLRHTFASIHIQLGTPVTYLKEQLGHSSIQMTVDIYGHWLSKTNPEAADRLDTAAFDSEESESLEKE